MRADVVDLSHFDGPIQMHKLQADGVKAVILKASQGSGYKDERFDGYLAQARSVGLAVGAYHFLTGDDADQQFANFKEVIQGKGPLLLAIDVERSNTTQPTPEILKGFIEQVVEETQRHPVVYGSDVLRSYSAQIYVACPGWIAAYGSRRPTWDEFMVLWQWSSKNGLADFPNVDCSEWTFQGDMLAWWHTRAVSI